MRRWELFLQEVAQRPNQQLRRYDVHMVRENGSLITTKLPLLSRNYLSLCLKEVDPGIADLDAVLAQLENIQTGGLMSCETHFQFKLLNSLLANYIKLYVMRSQCSYIYLLSIAHPSPQGWSLTK